ncbi:RHS repeat-associated core domain-containing protein [Pseudomonas sp. Marseille-QA0332]
MANVIHSSAANFLSFVQNSVDPRTGQYTLAIELPALVGNDLIGPQLPLRLSFNPFNDQDSGFGQGWNLALSQYVPATHMLSLHTGESYKVTGSGPQPAIREKKIDSFHFHDDSTSSDQRYRIVHKSGLVEMLTPFGDQQPVALPTRVQAPSGHHLELTYTLFQGQHCLERIVDGNGLQLLQLDYALGQVTLDLHPGAGANGAPFARYTLELSNRQLRKVILPTEDKASWRFEYARVRELTCLKKIWTPVGAVEDIAYEDDGHLLPGGGSRVALPRVTTHLIDPGSGQPPLKTTYTYTYRDPDTGQQAQNNFLGNNSGITWRDDGQDNLYRAQASYRYSVTSHHWQDDKIVRKQTRTYNRFHLMTLQTVEQDGHIEETETRFHERPDADFEGQPANFQLPHTVTKRWKLRDDASQVRIEQATTRYDEHGNLVEEVQPTGIRTVYEYYPKGGERSQDWQCPADPQGFVRHLKCMTVYPAPGQDAAAPVTRTRLSYAAYPPLTSAVEPAPWLAVIQESLLQVTEQERKGESEQLLQLIERGYLETPADAYLHGRVDYQKTTRYGSDLTDPLRKAMESRTTRTDWHYSKASHPELGPEHWIDETVTGFDLVQKRKTQALSLLHGQPTYLQDDLGNATRLRYDKLTRLVEEIVAPDSEDETRTRLDYTLVTEAGGQAVQAVTESSGVVTYLTLDGCNRLVKQERETEAPEGDERPRWRKLIAQTNHDGLGQVIEQTTFDYCNDQVVSLKSTFEYDAWGNLCKTQLPTGATLHIQHSPFGEHGDTITRWMETPDRPGIRQQQSIIETNRFDKPAWQCRVDETGKQVGRRDFTYDGLGQCTSEASSFQTKARRPTLRTTGYRYDPLGRITQTVRADASTVSREFATHSSNELTERLSVKRRGTTDSILAWDRTFDGIERLKTLSVGLRKETYRYQGDTSLIATRTTAAKRTFSYSYRPSLSAQPKLIEVAASKAEFDYDWRSAAIKSARNVQGSHTYAYTEQGYLREAQWKDAAGDEYTCQYTSSFQGLPLGYTDSDGVTVAHTYDELGRLIKTCQGQLEATITYDSAGRLHTTQTKDLANAQTLSCEQGYDDLGREILRTLTLSKRDGTVLCQTVEQQWREDDQLRSRTLSCDGEQLLEETFEYDMLDRLENHACSGSRLPRNAHGREIVNQFFVYDELDNLVECYTDFADGKSDEATFTYEGFLLRKVEHSLQPDYPASQAFEHDADGNLLNDERGNRLVYDEAGRLVEVRSADDARTLYRYRFDGHDHLLGVSQGQGPEVVRRYQGYRVSATLENGLLTQYLYAADRPLGLQRSTDEAQARLFLTDPGNSVVGESTATALHRTSYSAYGEAPDDSELLGLLGFNGEARERALGWYLLGRGYRAYNPALMRFHSPDVLAPEDAGINPYAYCGGDPVNWRDPSGHLGERYSQELPYVPLRPAPKPKADWRSWLGVAVGAVFAVVSFALLPPVGATFAFALGASSLALDVASTAASAAALVTGNQAALDASFWLGIGSAVSTLGVIGYSRFAGRSAAQGARQGLSQGTQTASRAVSTGVGGTPRGSILSRAASSASATPAGSVAGRSASVSRSSMNSVVGSVRPASASNPELDWNVLPGTEDLEKVNPLFVPNDVSHDFTPVRLGSSRETNGGVSSITPPAAPAQGQAGFKWKVDPIYFVEGRYRLAPSAE